VTRKQADFFASKGVGIMQGNNPKERLVRAHAAVNRKRRGVGKVAVTPLIEGIVAASHESLATLLDYYNEAGLLVPKRDSNYFNSLGWGLNVVDTPDLSPERLYASKANQAQKADSHYVFQSFEGTADRERRDIVTNFACIFGTRRQALRVAQQLLGSEYGHLKGSRL
jgi:hypothetical protein